MGFMLEDQLLLEPMVTHGPPWLETDIWDPLWWNISSTRLVFWNWIITWTFSKSKLYMFEIFWDRCFFFHGPLTSISKQHCCCTGNAIYNLRHPWLRSLHEQLAREAFTDPWADVAALIDLFLGGPLQGQQQDVIIFMSLLMVSQCFTSPFEILYASSKTTTSNIW